MDYLKFLFVSGILVTGAMNCVSNDLRPAGREPGPGPAVSKGRIKGRQLYADFETKVPALFPDNPEMNYRIVNNPAPDRVNQSLKCGRVSFIPSRREILYSEPMGGVPDKYVYGTFNLAGDTVFTLKVYTSVPGNVTLRVENPRGPQWGQASATIGSKYILPNQWTKLVFRFKRTRIKGKKFGKFTLIFSRNKHARGRGDWYFDDIEGPPVKKQPTLFHRYFKNRPYLSTQSRTWYSLHIANATILTPEETKDHTYKMFLRGSTTEADGKHHGNIGLFYQEQSSFDPVGKWTAYKGNPVIRHGPPGSYDSDVALDPAAVAGPDNNIYLYYKGTYDHRTKRAINGASSKDGGRTFIKFSNNPLLEKAGPEEVKYYGHQYYIFYGGLGRRYISLSVLSTPGSVSTRAVKTVERGPEGTFDSRSVAGAKIFRVRGDNRWFMIYQCSRDHRDFPERFHCAYSYDLKQWTKVKNHIPLFTRGSPGSWDQGGIWTGDVIEYDGVLYMYYEGWGKKGAVKNRNKDYFKGGKSQIGVAAATVGDFLKWCNG